MSSKQKIRASSKSPESKKSSNSINSTIKNTSSIGPVRPYLENTITTIVQKGLIELDKARPDNPLEFLGKFLLEHAND